MTTELLPEAKAYAERVEALGQQSALDPVERCFYGSHSSQALDIYAPAEKTDDLPVLLFFHGGAWINGGLQWLRFMAPVIVDLPAVFVAATYRLGPEFRWPSQYEDVRDAIRFCHEHVHSHGGNPARMVVGGHSSGGHLASMAVLKKEIPPVKGCFPVSSAFNLQYGKVSDSSPEARVYKYLFSDPSQDREASPINFISGNSVPFHIVWGEQDFERIHNAVKPMIDALINEGSEVSYEQVPAASHFDTHLQLGDAANPWYKRLRKVMKLC